MFSLVCSPDTQLLQCLLPNICYVTAFSLLISLPQFCEFLLVDFVPGSVRCYLWLLKEQSVSYQQREHSASEVMSSVVTGT